MVYKPRYLRSGLHVTMLVLVVKFTGMEEIERHFVQFPEEDLSTSLGIRGEPRLAAHPR
jgi:hypothetical protein